MDPLNIEYEKIDDVPEPFRPLFSENGGKFVLTHVNGLKTVNDVNALNEALRKERNDHSQARTTLKEWGDMKPSEVRAQLSRIAELEAAAGGKLDETGISKIVESRLNQKLAPVQQQLQEALMKSQEWEGKFGELSNVLLRRDMDDEIRDVAVEMKAHATAISDLQFIASQFLVRDEHSGKFVVKDGAKGFTPGMDVKGFMREMMKNRPHFWPASAGGGAGGGNGGPGYTGNNPWSAEHWNLTEQMQVIREKGQTVAENLAKAAGTTVGGVRPARKKN